MSDSDSKGKALILTARANNHNEAAKLLSKKADMFTDG